MLKKQLIISLVILLLGMNTQAKDIECETVDQCKSLLNAVQLKLSTLKKEVVYIRTSGPLYKKMNKITAMGQAWRDNNYLVWGDLHKSASGVVPMNFQQANDYCHSIGAKLPTAEDYVRLKIGMGASHLDPKKKGDYKPQILANLNVPFSVWTSTTKTLANGKKEAVMFQGMMGRFDETSVNNKQVGVRCVMFYGDFKKL